MRYADDFVILVHGTREHTEALREDVATVLAPLGLRLSAAKTQLVQWTFSKLDAFTWWRLAHMLRARHGWNWGQLRRHLRGPDGRWRIAADGVEYFRISLGVTVSRYTYRGYKIPTRWPTTNPA